MAGAAPASRQRRSAAAGRLDAGTAAVDLRAQLTNRAGQWLRLPVTWIITLLVLLLAIVVWQHPIARAIGTESAKPAPVAVVELPTLPPASAPASLPHRGRPHQLHHGTPRDPFHPLITAPSVNVTAAAPPPSVVAKHVKPGPSDWGAVATAPSEPPSGSTTATGSTHASRPPGATGSHPATGPTHAVHNSTAPSSVHTPAAVGECAATHVVRPGESLWSISEQHLVSRDQPANITAAWHKLYAANRATIGANPSVIQVGAHLCMPAT